MNIVSGFFDANKVSGVYDREYDSEDFSKCFDGFLTDGIVGKDRLSSTGFKVIANSSLAMDKVFVKPGYAWIKGRWAESTEDIGIEISMPADMGYYRVDAIFLRCDYDERLFKIVKKSGPLVDVNEDYPDEDYPQEQHDEHGDELLLAYLPIFDTTDDPDGIFVLDRRIFSKVKVNSVDMENYYTKPEMEQKLGGLKFIKCTQAQYNQMVTHDENTVYFII